MSSRSSASLDKTQLRQSIRHARRALSTTSRRQAAVGLLHSLRNSAHFQHSQHIGIYLTNDGEIDTSLLIKDLRQRGKTLYLPALHPLRKGHLSFTHWQAQTPMVNNRYGIAEPKFYRQRVIPARYLDLVCMPLVAFDSQGNRLGMGGGFYDRTLAFMRHSKQKPALIGLAYELQKVTDLPLEPWDVPLNGIATEKNFYTFSSC